jgi:hypothetical protein
MLSFLSFQLRITPFNYFLVPSCFEIVIQRATLQHQIIKTFLLIKICTGLARFVRYNFARSVTDQKQWSRRYFLNIRLVKHPILLFRFFTKIIT